MKKILLLGGSAQQVIAIDAAKKLGCYTILCDFLPDNPGQYVADMFYLASTTDKSAILEIAKKEKIDGILAYASDPAAPTAAFVAEQLGLPGNPFKSVDILCNKDKFRDFLKNNGFNTPQSGGYTNLEAVCADITRYQLPIIIKPVDSSGSKGTTILHTLQNLSNAIDFALSFSRSHRVVVEEVIEKKHPYLIGGDVFIYDGKIVQWGLLNCHRDHLVNPLVPVGKSYPLELNETDEQNVKETLQILVGKLNLKAGAMNVELIIDRTGHVYPIDIGPRSGGNMIPDLLNTIFKTNVIDMSVKAALGIPLDITEQKGYGYYATHNLHVASNGIFEGIHYSDEIKQYLIKTYIYKNIGDRVEYFDNSAKALGIAFFKFPSRTIMYSILRNINKYVKIELS